MTISLGEGGGRGLQPSLWDRNLQHSGNFRERTIGNSGNFLDCSPNCLTQSGRNFAAPLNLKPSYAYVYDYKLLVVYFHDIYSPNGKNGAIFISQQKV